MLFNFPFGSHKLPDDWVLRPVRPLPLCRLRFEPMSEPSFFSSFASSSFVPSPLFTPFPGVFSLFGQWSNGYHPSTSLALTLHDKPGIGGGGLARLLPACNWGRQPLRRLLADSPPPNESLCTFQLSWPPLAGATVTTSSPATMTQFRFTRR